jgi:hypothetical protein
MRGIEERRGRRIGQRFAGGPRGRSRGGRCLSGTQTRCAAFEFLQEIGVIAFGLGLGAGDVDEQRRQPVDGGKDERDMARRRRRAVAQSADQRLGGVGEARDARQTEKAARPFDRMDMPEKAGD